MEKYSHHHHHSRSRKKKAQRLISAIVIIAVLFTGGVTAAYLYIKPFLRPLTYEAFTWLQRYAAIKKIQTGLLEFEDVYWRFPDRIIWKNVSLHLYATWTGTFWGGMRGVLWASEIEAAFPKFILGEIELALRGGFFPASSDPENRFSFFADKCQLSIRMPLWPVDLIRLSMRRTFNEVFRILEDGATHIPIKMSGRIRFPVFGEEEEARIWLVEEKGQYRLFMHPDDAARIAVAYPGKLSDPEVKVIARYPLSAARALKITDESKRIARAMAKRNPNVPEDAFRHVWWSYHLTKAFGQQFCRELTNAHEAGSTTNTEADHLMDRRNNQVGSDYAVLGYSENSLLERTMKDPKVIRSPSEAYRKTSIADAS